MGIEIVLQLTYIIPYLNRFLSADSIVPNPANPQSFNRYSYVLNRPLILTDPSGHMPSDGCGFEGCLTDADSWASNFVQYLLDNTDFNDPSDNPVGQFVLGFYFDELESWNPIQGPLTNEEALMDSIRGTNAYLNSSGMHPADALQAHHSMGMLFDFAFFSALYYGGARINGIQDAIIDNHLASSTILGNSGNALISYDPEYASRTILGQYERSGYGVTPNGRTVSAHAAERIVYGAPGRPPTTLNYVDEILNTGTQVRFDPIRNTIQVRATHLPGRPYVVVSGSNPNHIVTVMVPR